MKTVRSILNKVDWPAIPSPSAEKILAALELRIGQKVPTLFRELWSLEKGPDFLARYSNADQPISPSNLGEPLEERWPGYDALDDDVLPFMIENQGICAWGLRLDSDDDDPSVVVEVDSGTPPHWRECADRFSDWLACQVEDALLLEACWFGAKGPPLDDSVLVDMHERYSAGEQSSVWPGAWNYRFHDDKVRLLLWNSESQCDWWIAPKSADVAMDVLDDLDAIASIGRALYAPKDEHAEALRQWRERSKD